MTPGLALFYGGLVRRKNVLSTIMHSFFILGPGQRHLGAVGLHPGLRTGHRPRAHRRARLAGARGRDRRTVRHVRDDDPAPRVHDLPEMFAIITPALITGAFAERKRFKAFVIFAVAWSTLVYAPIAHWVWSPDGWLFGLGALDFAGGTVVHLSSGIAALVAALFIGRRTGLIERADGAARRADDRPRRGPAVVRLVRLQRRLGARRQRARRQRVRHHQHRGRHGRHHLGHRQLAPQGHAVGPRCGARRGRRPGRHHPRRRVRDAGRVDPHRPRRRRRLLRRGADPAPRLASTTRSTSSRSTAWAARSAPSPPASSPPPR